MKTFLLSICGVFCFVLSTIAIQSDSCGQKISGAAWKWHVQLLHIRQAPAQAFQCSGTLLNQLFVTTAAHCLYDLNGDPLDKSQLGILLADGENRSIIRTFQPEPFDVERLSNDFALLLLDRAVVLNELVAPICLPEPYTVLPQIVHTPALNGKTLPVNSGVTCLHDAQTLFGMMYADAICLGQFESSLMIIL
ncbi:hypothetical protein RP20_CCG020151 [Aedes albopictus]|nr:transmembrane protease serine 3-like [Aedes albopictus]KXJ81369.1 hypothetical protein RP20_CCG020151 [Aedes albopictus]